MRVERGHGCETRFQAFERRQHDMVLLDAS